MRNDDLRRAAADAAADAYEDDFQISCIPRVLLALVVGGALLWVLTGCNDDWRTNPYAADGSRQGVQLWR